MSCILAVVGRKPNPERKPELLRAVVAELARSGLAGVSLRPLAHALGGSTYTPAYHFGSKGQPQGGELLPGEHRRRLMSAWVELISGELQAHGVPKRRASVEATIAASALAGMVLDLLATGDQRRLRTAVRALGERLVAAGHAQFDRESASRESSRLLS